MRQDFTAGELAELAAGYSVLKTAIWIEAKERGTGNPAHVGFWSGQTTLQIQVVDALTGATELRTFYNAGSLGPLERIVMKSALEVQTIDIRLSQVDPQIAQAIRGYDSRAAPTQIYRLICSNATMLPVAAGRHRFVGIVNHLKIRRGNPQSPGYVDCTFVNQVRELTVANTEVRDDESQQLRATGDRFYRHTQNIHQRIITWGRTKGPAGARKKRPPDGAGKRDRSAAPS